MTNYTYGLEVCKRLEEKKRDVRRTVHYPLYDPYADEPEIGREILADTFLEPGDPLPPIIPGYAFCSDRGEKSVNGKGVAVCSLGCQTEPVEEINEIAELERQIRFKNKQHEFVDRVVNNQLTMLKRLRIQIREVEEEIASHHWDGVNLDYKPREVERLEEMNANLLKYQDFLFERERMVSGLIKVKTCYYCRVREDPKYYPRFDTSVHRRAVRLARKWRELEPVVGIAYARELCAMENVQMAARAKKSQEEQKKKAGAEYEKQLALIRTNEQKKTRRQKVFAQRRQDNWLLHMKEPISTRGFSDLLQDKLKKIEQLNQGTLFK